MPSTPLANLETSQPTAVKSSVQGTPCVSVLLPAYNAELFLDAAVASVRAQTIADWEIVAVDDSSKDGTYDRLVSWAKQDPRVRAFRNETNQGMTGNWNRCLAQARGEFVLKLDADDALRPRALEVLTNALATPGVIGAGARTLLCTEDLEPFGGLPADDAMLNAGINPYTDHDRPCASWEELALRGHQLWHSCAFMARRETLQASGGYDARFGCASDTELLLRLLGQGGSFAHRAYVGVLYRQVAGSISSQFRANDWLTWEATAVSLLALHRYRQGRPLPGSLRRRYVEQWQHWRTFRRSAEFKTALPPAVRDRLSDVIREVAAPPRADRLVVGLRALVSRLLP